jgi:hypothetical protein
MWLEPLPDLAQIDDAVDGAERVIGGNSVLEAEALQQRRLPDLPLVHQGCALGHQEG